MIDLHVHALHGVDDGPATRAAAVAMCQLAAADGVTTMVVTPHQRHEEWPNLDHAALTAALEELRRAVGPRPALHLGGEIRVDSELLAEVDAMPGGELVSLADSRYLLLEFDPLAPGMDPRGLVHELVIAGWRPVIAHPERIAWFEDIPGLVADLVGRGASLQVTAMSVTGRLGRRAQANAASLLDAGLVAFVGSDGHDPVSRPPVLSDARRFIADRWGEAVAERVTELNPRAVLDDRPLEEVHDETEHDPSR